MAHLHLDCFSGISGDMFLGALVDVGFPLADMKRGLKKMNLDGYQLTAKKVLRGTIHSTKVDVQVRDGFSKPLSLPTIRRILTKSQLPSKVKARSLEVFQRLAEAEGTVHGVPLSQVHFHEVGVVDSLVDIVGAFLGCESLGIDKVSASPVNLGSGTVNSAHGALPVPAPAVAHLVKEVPIFAAGPIGELTTPTGMGLLTTLTRDFCQLPFMRPRHIGYGAGSFNPKGWANVLRVFLSKTSASPSADIDHIVQLQTNLDDLNPQAYEPIMDHLFSAGALDVTLTPSIMKRGRPGIILTVLTPPAKIDPVLKVFFYETTTLGVRVQEIARRVLPRKFHSLRLHGTTVRVKVAEIDGGEIKAMPEYQDCQRIAKSTGRPVREVMIEALQALKGLRRELKSKLKR